MWILDTVTLSEATKNDADPAVMDWLDTQDSRLFYTSAICIGELQFGIDRMTAGQKKDRLKAWLAEELLPSFGDNIIGVDRDIAQTWGQLRAQANRTLPFLDSLIGATALHHNFAIVTRNTKDYELIGVDIFNPWIR